MPTPAIIRSTALAFPALRAAALILVLSGLASATAAPAAAQSEPGLPLEPRFVPRKPEHTDILDGFSRERAHLKFRQGTQVRLRDGMFVTLGQDDLSGLYMVLASYPAVVPARLFDARSEEELAAEKERLERSSGREQGDKNLYFRLQFPDTTDAEALLDDLNALAIVELAYPESEVELDPTMHTPDFRPDQGYREAAPDGIHADAANSVPGGRGQNVQIIDIERYFNPTHEDLPSVTEYANGDPLAAFAAPFDHGTAVLGQIFGVDNGFGVLGLADQAAAGFVTRANGVANAVDVAASNAAAGDVILLEVQQAGANGGCASQQNQVGCVAAEFVQANYDAIVAATSAGIIVVEAAGNGGEDFDGSEYDDAFRNRPDSEAILVGAGSAPGCTGPEPRGRLAFSNIGARVNLQGWGECVTTTGYGTSQGSPDSDDAYTGGFSGTSSASPIVAAAAGIVSSVAVAQGDADGLTSLEARDLLVATGTPQALQPAGNIGPLPNLAAALGLEADLEISKAASPVPAVAGETLTYTLGVTNQGPNLATDVVVVDDLPAGVSFVSSVPSCELDALTGDRRCPLGQLGVGDSADVEIEVSVAHDLVFDAGGPVPITNLASVESTIDDPDLANNATSLDTQVVAIADLELESLGVGTAPPAQLLIGDSTDVTIEAVVTNHGPSWPMDAEVAMSASGPGVDVAPAAAVLPADALKLDEQRSVDQTFTVTCEAPGPQEVSVTAAIAPADPADADPDPSNDEAELTFQVECVVPVAINVRPANRHNFVHPGSEGVVPVAILTTLAGEYGLPVAFDATAVVTESVRFGRPDAVFADTGGASAHTTHLRDSFEPDDRSKDRDLDLVQSFRTSQTGIEAADVEACAKGLFDNGLGGTFVFFGCDAIATLPPN